MKNEREYNYDLLRVFCMLSVIMIHVSSTWVGNFSAYISNGGGSIDELKYPIISCLYNSISRFAVPCFIMLSGAFILDDSRTANYKQFYQKRLMKIGVPIIVFSIIYILYRIPLCLIGDSNVIADIVILIKDIIKGVPFEHMWYLFMLLNIYLLSPIVMRFKDSIAYENFRKIAFVFLIVASFSRWTTERVRLSWDIGQSFEYLGYFMMGYVLRKDLQKNNRKGFIFITLGEGILILTAFIEYKFQIVNGIGEGALKYRIVSPYCPNIVIASLLIFAGFSMLRIGYNTLIDKLASMSFIIYLFHDGVWDFFNKLIYHTKGANYIITLNNIYWIPIFVAIVLIISILLTIIYRKIELYFMLKLKQN